MHYELCIEKGGEASVSSVYSVDCPQLVFIRVNSWFLKNDLVAALAVPDNQLDFFLPNR